MANKSERPSWFQRFLLPGFAFKAVVIGGGYATGRELAEFFLPSGPWGGVAAMVLAMGVWSLICALTFALAHSFQAYDYRTFFEKLVGPAWVVFEIAYVAFVILILSVFAASAGAIGAAMLGWPLIAGTLVLAAAIAAVVTFGNKAVERLFKYVSFLLYGVYALFVVLALTKFGGDVAANFAAPSSSEGWVEGGLTYASYNIVGAVVILPVIRHMTSRRDALVAGAIAGPLAMLPALLFFVCMIAFYPGIAAETLPSDFMLQRLNLPVFHWLFQLMIFAALLESGAGAVHAINERIASVWVKRRKREFSRGTRLLVASLLLIGCVFAAESFGLVTLIGQGYRLLAWTILAVFVLPVLTIGVFRLSRPPRPAPARP